MGKFSRRLKHNKKSLSIDEKIKFLDKEMEKTGVFYEVAPTNSVQSVYSQNETQPNTVHTSFTSSTFNDLPLGFSGSDGSGLGGAYTGKVVASEHGLSSPSHDSILNLEGVAVSPPHPVSGQRRYASTRTGMVSFSPTQPGKIQGNSEYPTGSVIWIWNPTANNSDGTTGQWFPLEFHPIHKKYGFWDSNFLGFGFLNINLDQLEFTSGDNTGTTLNTLVNNNGFNVQTMGQPDTTVLITKPLENPDNLPIMIDGLSGPGYEYIKNKALASADPNIAFFGNKGKGKVNKKLFKGTLANTLNLLSNQIVNGQDSNGSLQKQFDRITGGSISPEKYNELHPILTNPSVKETEFNKILDDVNKSSADDDLDSFASAGYEPETVTVPTDSEAGEGPKPSKSKGKDAKLGEWMSRTDFMALYPDSSMVEYLSALPYGATNFTTPTEKGWELNTKGFENYFLNGDLSSLSDSKPKHTKVQEVEYTPQELKKGFSVSQTLNYLKTKFKSPLGPATDIMADIVANTFGQKASKAVLDDYMRNFIPDLFRGKNPAGATSGNPRNVGNMYSDKSIKDFEKVYNFHKTTVKPDGTPYEDDTVRWKTDYQKISDANSEIGNTFGTFGDTSDGSDQFVDNGDGTETLIKRYDFDRMKDMAGSSFGSTLGAYSYGIISGIPGLLGKGEGGKTPSAYLSVTFDKKTGKVIKNYKKGIAESLDESVKLGHFDPEALTVDIEKLRKGILPEFPKKAPPKMIDGHSEKSKLAPKKAEKVPFIKITKKDLLKNHKLKDSEIKEFMDTFKMINDFIKKHPEELIHAQQRYPIGDQRLAELNWKMDQMLEAGEEYLDTQFPENQRLVDRIKKATKKTMELTNPEAYKGLKKPDMELMSLDDHMKEKRVVSRHFKKKRQNKSMFRVNMEKVKEKNRKVAEQKVAEWQEKRRIELLNSNEFDELKSDWKKDLQAEGMTTQMLTGILPSTGDADLENVPLGVSGGHAPVSYGSLFANSEEDPNTIPDGTEYTALTNLEPLTTVVKGNENDWNATSQEAQYFYLVRTFDQATQTWGQSNGGSGGFWSYLVPGFKDNTLRNVQLSGRHSTRDLDHPTDPGGYHPTSTFGSNDRVGEPMTNSSNKDSGAGVVLSFRGPGSPRFIALKPVDATQVDTIKVHALVSDTNLVRAGAHSSVDCRPQIYYWAGNHPDFKKSFLNGSIAKMANNQNVTSDGWRPINMKPNGDIDPSVDPFFIKYREDEDASGNKNRAPGYRLGGMIDGEIVPTQNSVAHSRIYPYSLKLPEWTNVKDARFMLIQHFDSSNTGSFFNVSGVRYQRKNNMKIPALTKPLSDIETSPFVRVGPTKKNEGGKERKKKVQDIIRSGLKYTGKQFGQDFPVRTDLK